ncbi:MAG: thioredoxin family protein [Calditrichia bacterium]
MSLNEKLRERKTVLTYFSYPDCNVCKVLLPKVKDLLKDYPQIDFLYVDTQQEPEVSGQYLVFAVPTIILFYEGREAKRFSRHFSLQELSEFLERLSDA